MDYSKESPHAADIKVRPLRRKNEGADEMKLPETVRQALFAANGYRPSTEPKDAAIEVIVRDCANVCSDGILVADVRVGSEQFAKAILTRYSLEPKP